MSATKQDSRIRVGLIGANKRALWYGAIFARIDPEALFRMDPAAHHHMTGYYDAPDLWIRRATGFRVEKIYDADASAAQAVARAFRPRLQVCRTVGGAAEGVDLVFIANETGDGAAHRELATPGLERGLPTFIDRPFTRDVGDARALVALAQRRRAPLLSCSHLRLLPQAGLFKARFPEVGAPEIGMVQGHGPNPAQIADGIELAMTLFGDEFGGRAQTAQSMGDWPNEIVHLVLRRAGGKRVCQVVVVNSHTSALRQAFWAKSTTQRFSVDSPSFDLAVQSDGGRQVMEALRDMVRTGKPPLPYAAMVESVAIAQAGRTGWNKPRPVSVKR